MIDENRSFGPLGTETNYLLVGPSTLEVGSLGQADTLRFGLANVAFFPADFTDNPSGFRRDQSTFRLDGADVRVRLLDDHKERIAYLRRAETSLVTAEALFPASIGLGSAKTIVGELCELLSIALGTSVNWLYCDARSDGSPTSEYSLHYPAIAAPFRGGQPLIDPRESQDIALFIEGCHEGYRQIRMEWDFGAVCHALTECRGTGFLDSRTLIAAALIDALSGREAKRRDATQIVKTSRGQRRRINKALRESLVTHLPTATDLQVDEIMAHASQLWWTSIKRKIEMLADTLSVTITPSELTKFAKTRNRLAHYLRFDSEDRLNEHLLVLSILDRLVLGILGYRGPYVDVTTGARRQMQAGAAADSLAREAR
jgi:hypothetical protein